MPPKDGTAPSPARIPGKPPRATHPKLKRALAALRSVDLCGPCQAQPPAALSQAIHTFNQGEFFEQHETLENLWRATPGEVRHLYEGILQVGVGMHHLIEKCNFHGAAVKLDHGIRLLSAFPEVCQGVDVARLRADARRARLHLLRLGPERMAAFDASRIPRVHLVAEGQGTVAHG